MCILCKNRVHFISSDLSFFVLFISFTGIMSKYGKRMICPAYSHEFSLGLTGVVRGIFRMMLLLLLFDFVQLYVLSRNDGG